MDFSWLDISSSEPSSIKPTLRNAMFLLICVALVFVATVGSLWFPFGYRAVAFLILVVLALLLLIRDFVGTHILGLLLFTLIGYRVFIFGRVFESSTIFAFLILLLYSIHLLKYGKKIWVSTELNKYIFIFWIVIIAGIINSIIIINNVPLNAIHEPLTYILPVVIFFVIISFVKTKQGITLLFTILFILLSKQIVSSVIQFALRARNIGELEFGGFVRVGADFGNPNVLAGWLEIILPVVIAFLLTSKNARERILLLILAISGYITLLMTFSRGGFILGIGASGLILIFKVKNKALSAVVIAVFVVAIILGSGYLARQMTLFSYEDIMDDDSIAHRVVQYLNYWIMIKEYPILGIGWGARFMYTHFGMFERSVNTITYYGHLNSTVFDMGVHNGILGIVSAYLLYFMIVYKLFKNSRIIRDKRLSMISWCLGVGFLSFIGHSLFDGFIKFAIFSNHFWTMAGLGFAARVVWDNYGDKIDEIDRFKFKFVNPLRRYLRKP